MKNKYAFRNPSPPFPCFFGCGRSLATKYDRLAIDGWEWFSGYGDGPIHFCPHCSLTRRDEIDRIRDQLNVKPANYPHEFAKVRDKK